jgi:hypothetical protein
MLSRHVRVVALCFAAVMLMPSVPVLCAEPAVNPYLGAHVRGLTPEMVRLIDHGTQRSATFKSLVTALNNSDVVVYLGTSMRLPKGVDGRLVFMTSAGGVRYLYAEVIAGLSLNELVATVGHELQHALEVATHAEVRDAASLASLYERIGIPSHTKNRYDTVAAQSAGRRVRAELG